MISLTIDNREIKAPEGTKVLEAALENNIDIPHMCYHPELKPFGGCRLCLVEVEGEEKLVASCVMPVAEGMNVQTSNTRIDRARRSIVQLLLLNHPMDCLVCERGGSCLLQKLAFELKVVPDKYKMNKRLTIGVQKRSILEIDPRKCMHCGLCVRVCKELRHFGAIDFYNRGFKTEIGIPFSDESNCEFCGQCVEVCPVAGVVGLDSKYVARPWELTHSNTICPYCGTGCLITLDMKQGRVVKISSKDTSGVNKGKTCVKGRFGCGFINSEDRLTSPLVKVDGQFKPASWKDALTYTAKRLKNIKETHGSQAIGGLGSVKSPNEDNYLFQKFMRAVIGTNNIDNYNRLEHSPTLAGLSETLGLVTANNSLDKIDTAELILVLGSNPSSSHPIVSLKIKAALKSNNSKLLVASPRKIGLASQSDQWLKLRPGTYLTLLGGIMHIIVNESLVDEQSVKDTRGFEEFKSSLKEYQTDRVARITGVPEEELVQAAKMIAKAQSLAVVYSAGLTQHVTGTRNVTALADLFILTGHAGREQSGIFPLRYDSNSQGVCDMGVLPEYLPGYQPIDDDKAREKFEQAWGTEIPSTPGLTSVEMFDAIEKGTLKALYIMGYNPIRDYPNSQSLKKSFESLDFLVVQDLFLSPTAMLADVVFPAASFAERDGTITSMERRVQKITQALPEPGDAAPDWKIIMHLSKILGYPMEYPSVTDVMKEINELVPIYGGITYDRLEGAGLFWPCPDTSHPGTKFMKPTISGFAPLPATPVEEEVDKDYPYKLIIGGTLFHSGGGTLSMKSKMLKEICPEGFVDLNPGDAAKLGINTDDTVRISSQRASVEAKARLTPQNPEGIVFMPKEFEELQVQELIPVLFDPVSHIPAMKVCAVNLSKVSSPAAE